MEIPLCKNYQSTIPGFEKETYDCHCWDDIRVPAHIQMEGYDVPQYVTSNTLGKAMEKSNPEKFQSSIYSQLCKIF